MGESQRARSGGPRRPPVSWLLPDAPRAGWRWWVPAQGRCWFLIAALLLGIGLFKNINLLLLLAYLLASALLFNALTAGRWLSGLRTRARVEGPVFAGVPCTIEVEVTNPGRRSFTGVRIEHTGPDHSLAWFATRLDPGDVFFRSPTILPRRGRYRGAIHAASGYPFSLVWQRRRLAESPEWIVLPRLGWVHLGRLRQFLRRSSPEGDTVRRRRPQRHPTAQAEFHGLRAWRPGDSPRLIHWRTTARCGELMVREYEDEPSDNLLLVLDPTARSPAAFEEAVSLAATICWEWCRGKGDRLIATVADGGEVLDGVAGRSHGRAVMERLALAEAGTAADGRVVAKQLASLRLVPAAAVVVAAGSSGLVGPLGAALGRNVVCLDPADAEVRDFYEPPGVGGSAPPA
jgi:uncharacterized protein (DUF58 family)